MKMVNELVVISCRPSQASIKAKTNNSKIRGSEEGEIINPLFIHDNGL
jgi:hypothetical protein